MPLARAIASLALDVNNFGQGFDSSSLVAMLVKPDSARCSYPAPMTHQQRAAEQVRPDLQPIVPPFIYLRSDTRERRTLRR